MTLATAKQQALSRAAWHQGATMPRCEYNNPNPIVSMRRSGNIHAILTCSTTDIIKTSTSTSTRKFMMGSSIAGMGTTPRPTSTQKQARAANMAARMSSVQKPALPMKSAPTA
eukprot:CAMPEP_0202338146 /NCGR_PEP_ID=MMETSP1126-20121109/537_1 /ASSEMBLY_ACC=CAM_ASM_000457 /TAXON_ID=3047 /ORGANISM="Dunaliella tertiolecta, Strain CCMP1320" /LENGTH=112 /DNA_ID=CAMNT_0048928463 /DNA_START=1665 /DNA_END=2003 /DNA_ORIENTATION=-